MRHGRTPELLRASTARGAVMADVVESLPPPHHVPGQPKYSKFFDGQKWRLVLGKDCPASMNVAQNALRVTAKRAGIVATIRQSKKEGVIYVQANLAKKPAKNKSKK
jgi:hypothetical protein